MEPYTNRPPSGDRRTDSTGSAGPSIDGIVGSSSPSRAAQPGHPNRSTPVAPSKAARPFQPAGFYQPPPAPKLPVITEEPPRRKAEVPKKNQGLKDALSVVGVLASALLLAFCLINFVFQSYQVEGQSMRTTLEDRDHLIVWKVDRTIANLTGNDYIPNRGDVVIFSEPSDAEPGAQAGKQLIKRVLALPGERIVMKGADVTVYNKDFPSGFNPDETLPYGKLIVNNEATSDVDFTISEGQVFVTGDNRDNSLDSRVFGPLDTDEIVGKLAVRILPLNSFKLF